MLAIVTGGGLIAASVTCFISKHTDHSFYLLLIGIVLIVGKVIA